jgi:mRNA interferase YafQ
MRTPIYSTRFRKDYKLCQKRGYSMSKLLETMGDLESEAPLSPLLKEHSLQGDYSGCLECHIEPDWLLVYQIDDKIKEVYFVRTGTHSDIF